MKSRVILGWILSLLFLTAGCERLVSDSATRLAYQIRDEAKKLRRSGQTSLTFEHRPVAWPDGLTGDYRIAIISTPTSPAEKRSIFTAKSYDGRFWSSTSYHLNYVQVPKDLMVAHRKGEPTTITLELRDGIVLVVDMR
jgi:hypothetical protein